MYNLIHKWDSYISLIKANNEVMTSMLEMERQEKQGGEESVEKSKAELKEGEQQTADEEATSGSDNEVMDLEKEELDLKKEEKTFQEEAAKIKDEIKAEEKEEKKEEDPMQKLFTELFHRVGKFLHLYKLFHFFFLLKIQRKARGWENRERVRSNVHQRQQTFDV